MKKLFIFNFHFFHSFLRFFLYFFHFFTRFISYWILFFINLFLSNILIFLVTSLKQLLKKKKGKLKKKKFFFNSPQKKGICLKVYVVNPKKPNSANRKVAKVKLSNGKVVIGYIPGEGHSLQQHSLVLVQGGRAKDLPGVRFRFIRKVLDFV